MNHPSSIVYLGPAGTFCHEAALQMFPERGSDLIPAPTARAVLKSVRDGTARLGVVPVENSVQGEVLPTLDALIFNFTGLFVRSETVVPVSFSAFRRGDDQEPVRTVLSHPHALAQCSRFIKKLGAAIETTDSTARACEQVATRPPGGSVSIASRAAGQLYGLKETQSAIEDHRGAVTRFYVVGTTFLPPSGRDKSIFVLNPKIPATGILVRLLRCFADRSIDLLTIYSRPLKSSLGSYCFVVVVEGHVANIDMQDALRDILSIGARLKFLGSFPASQGAPAAVSLQSIAGAIDRADDLNQLLARMLPTDEAS